jgi:hypothetical protein
MFQVAYFLATRSCAPERIVSLHTRMTANHRKNLSPPAMLSTKEAFRGPFRHPLLPVHHPYIPRTAHLSLQNHQGYSSHQFHHSEDRMANPLSCPIHSHLTHMAAISNSNMLHYLQRIVAHYKNLRLCCEVKIFNKTILRDPSFTYTWNTVFIALLFYYNYVSYTPPLAICITTLITTDLKVLKVAHISFTPRTIGWRPTKCSIFWSFFWILSLCEKWSRSRRSN